MQETSEKYLWQKYQSPITIILCVIHLYIGNSVQQIGVNLW